VSREQDAGRAGETRGSTGVDDGAATGEVKNIETAAVDRAL